MSSRDEVDKRAERRGNEEFLTQFYRSETPWLVRYFRRNTPVAEDALDLAHETFARFVQAIASRAVTTPQAFLRRIAINLARDRAKSGVTRIDRMKVPLIEDLDRTKDCDQHRTLEARDDLELCQRVLLDLDAETLEMFLMSRVEELSYREIGKKLNVHEWTVRRRVLAVLENVHSALEGE